MNLNKTRKFDTSSSGAGVTLDGDGTLEPALNINHQYVGATDLREIAKQLKKWAKKLEEHEAGVNTSGY